MNWIEVAELELQLAEPVASEVDAFLHDHVLTGQAAGEADWLVGRSVRFQIRDDLLLLCDIHPEARTVDVVSIELVANPTSLA
ncbi:MAG: hypothetical protein ACK5RL_11215 [Acidimicrobiales bacterium]